MNTLDKFNCKRLWAVVKRDFAMEWKGSLALFVGLTCALLAALIPIILSPSVCSNWITIADTFYSWFSFLAFVGVLIQASRLLHPLTRKSGSIDMLMLPASNAEKFVSRVLLATVGYAVIVVVALEVVSLLYYPLALLLGECKYGSLSLYAFKAFFGTRMNQFQVELNGSIMYGATWFSIGWWLWVHSAFALGSALWRRYAFVKTFFAGILVTLVLGIILTQFWHPETSILVEKTLPVVLNSLAATMFVFAVACWTATYKLFVRKQIVDIKRRRL